MSDKKTESPKPAAAASPPATPTPAELKIMAQVYRTVAKGSSLAARKRILLWNLQVIEDEIATEAHACQVQQPPPI